MNKTLAFGAIAIATGLAAKGWVKGSNPESEKGLIAAKRHSLDVGGTTMSWLEHGEGVPVILLHGIPTSPALWRHVIPRLSGVRALAWEMVGYGDSMEESKGRDISVAAQAEYLKDWMNVIGLEKAVIAGHDLGGGVAQIFAVRNPEMCSGLFLTNAIGYDSWPIPSVRAMRETGGIVRHLPDSAFTMLLLTLLLRGHDRFDAALDAWRHHTRKYLDHGGAEALVRQIDALDVKDTLAVSDQLTSLEMPARLAWGDADGFQKIEYGERFARDLAAPLRKIAGGKHFTPEDHPDVIAEEILALVKSAHPEVLSPNSPSSLAMEVSAR